uniref:CRAL-TRIO domain-containing protein n=1 Tax=Anolis carolinensis TaxID=28377 RepID=H9GDP8_ANOCA
MDTRDPDGRAWRIFLTEEQEQRVDLSAVGPYKKVISHAGYDSEGLNAIIMFAVCYLPDSSIPDYPYVMENLFRYIVGTLELMVAQNYVLVCLNGAAPRSRLPSFAWIKQCYQTIDRRLRKNLKALVIVHPAWYVKALVAVFRPFIRWVGFFPLSETGDVIHIYVHTHIYRHIHTYARTYAHTHIYTQHTCIYTHKHI